MKPGGANRVRRRGWIAAGLIALALACLGVAVGSRHGLESLTRVADASTDACLARCADTSAACKRVCPSTFGAPCLSSCDSQHQMCRQSCQR